MITQADCGNQVHTFCEQINNVTNDIINITNGIFVNPLKMAITIINFIGEIGLVQSSCNQFLDIYLIFTNFELEKDVIKNYWKPMLRDVVKVIRRFAKLEIYQFGYYLGDVLAYLLQYKPEVSPKIFEEEGEFPLNETLVETK